MTLVTRRLLSLSIFFAIAGAGGLLLYWQERHSQDAAEAKKTADKLFGFTKVDDVVGLSLVTPAGSFEIARQAGAAPDLAWRLTRPQGALAEKMTVEALLGQLASLSRSREVGEKLADGSVKPPTDLSIFALDPPRIVVTVTLADGSREALHVGKKSSFDGSLFVTVPGKDGVAVVDGALEYQVNKDLTALREKRLAIFDTAEVSALQARYRSIAKPGRTEVYRVDVDVDADRYTLRAPIEAPADGTQISGLLSSLATVRAKSFAAEEATAAALHTVGLDHPDAEVELTLKDKTSLRLAFAEQKQGNATVCYAVNRAGGPVLELGSSAVLGKIRTDVEDLRDRRVLHFDRAAVKKIRMQKGETTLAFEERHDDEENTSDWFMTAPAEHKVSDATLSGLLYQLGNLKGDAVLADAATDAEWADAGLEPPELSIELAAADGAGLATLLGGAEDKRGRAAAAKGSRRIFHVPSSALQDISFTVTDYDAPAAKELP
ncbi:MAG: DUF4340 domain-containing protein [Deltaproteobacteria bacterium]|nr:DUF4340 domain-containing protein [Deltaproteobacteria bacterium]